MRLLLVACGLLLLLSPLTAHAGQKSVTYFLDGARVEEDAKGVKGFLEYPLPDSFSPGSLRVKPVGQGNVLRVEVVSVGPDQRRVREIAQLEQKKNELKDRIESLSTREEIFSAAAKSQSGKAPRKSKTNPDPVGSLKQGTDFALGQLDAAAQGKRRCQRALYEVECKLAVARKGSTLARVWLSAGGARLSYLVTSEKWLPCYDFRWSGDGKGELLLHARLPRTEKGVQRLVSNGTVAQGAAPLPAREDFPVLSRHPLTLQGDPGSPQPPLAFRFQPLQAGLPAGEAAAFWRGEYLGSGRFSGGEATELSIGGK